MELDRVRSNTGLAMLEVEEGDPGDTRSPAQANRLSCPVRQNGLAERT